MMSTDVSNSLTTFFFFFELSKCLLPGLLKGCFGNQSSLSEVWVQTQESITSDDQSLLPSLFWVPPGDEQRSQHPRILLC